MLPRLTLIGIMVLLEVIIMNKFDGINNMNFDSNFTSSKLIRPSFPEPNDDLNGLEYYAIFRNFWIKEFDYFRDKSIKYIIDSIMWNNTLFI